MVVISSKTTNTLINVMKVHRITYRFFHGERLHKFYMKIFNLFCNLKIKVNKLFFHHYYYKEELVAHVLGEYMYLEPFFNP